MLKASLPRALLEITALTLLWLWVVFTFATEAQLTALVRVISFANTFGACLWAVRLRPLPLWQEAGGMLIYTLLMTGNVILVGLWFASTTILVNHYLQVVTVGAPVLAINARLLVRFWVWWNRLQERYFIWALTHAHLMVIETILLSILVTLFVFQVMIVSDFWQESPTSLTAVDILLQIEPYVTVGLGLTFVTIVLVLPPSALISYWVSNRLVRRILLLEQVTAQVEQGDYSVKVPVEGEDEIARLQARYNAMTAQLHHTMYSLRVEQATVAGLSNLQREVVANISHDLRTPLATLQVYVESLPPAESIQRIKDELEHLRRLTDDLFQSAKQERFALTLRLVPLAIKPLIEQVVEVTKATAKGLRQVELASQVPDDLPLLWLDADRLGQILRNLLQNALRWTPPGGMILVVAEVTVDEVQIRVQDTGIGIASDELSHIWRRSYQVDPTTEGSGLGLGSVKQWTEAMQGRAEVQSVVNEGTCFTLSFPIPS